MSRVLCIGEVLFDRIAGHPAETVEAVENWHCFPGGAPANVATALVKLGTAAGFVGCVGQDAEGTELLQLLQHIGVNLDGVQRHPSAPTRVVDVLRNEAGDRRFAGFSDRSTYDFADAFLKGDAIPDDYLQTYPLLVTGTLGLAPAQSGEAITQVVQRFAQMGGEIVVDVNWRPMFWEGVPLETAIAKIKTLLHQAHWIKLTDEEADLLFQTRDLKQLQAIYPQVKGFLMTAGDQGCWYRIQDHEGHLPAFTVETVDTTGAGDSFLAGFLHQLGQRQAIGTDWSDGPEIFKMLQFASAVGALTTLKPGAIAAQPTLEAVNTFLANL